MINLQNRKRLKKDTSNKKYFMEFFGVLALTYVGCWTCIFMDIKSITRNGYAICQAFLLTILIWLGSDISGAYYNPAITLALVVVKRINWTTALFYLIAQFAGAVVGAFFVQIQLNSEIAEIIKDKSKLGLAKPMNNIYEVSGVWGELIGTYLMSFVFIALCLDNNRPKKIAIGAPAVGFIVYCMIMTIGEVSGGVFNPARAIGPALILGTIEKDQFMQFFSPIFGAICGILVYTFLFIEDEEDIKEEEEERKLRNEAEDELKDEQDVYG